MINNHYSWHSACRDSLISRRNAMPHALLLSGRSGTGKHDFAVHLAQTLLCASPQSNAACNQCQNCVWFNENHHPDFRLISPENEETSEDAPKRSTSKKTQISIAQIRELNEFLSLSTHQTHGLRIILISPAEALNSASANALLKMLEEPPANTLFLLVTSKPQQLLPTILSRCQLIEMPAPSQAEALAWLSSQSVADAESWLDYAGGAPLLAKELSQHGAVQNQIIENLRAGRKLNPANCASSLIQLGMPRALEILQKWIYDLTSYCLLKQLRYHLTQSDSLQSLSKGVNLRLLLQYDRILTEAKKTANHPLSNEMQLENLLTQYTHIFN